MDETKKKIDLFELLEKAKERPLTPEQEALRQKMLADKKMMEMTRLAMKEMAEGRAEPYRPRQS